MYLYVSILAQVAWCKKVDLSIERVFPRTIRIGRKTLLVTAIERTYSNTSTIELYNGIYVQQH